LPQSLKLSSRHLVRRRLAAFEAFIFASALGFNTRKDLIADLDLTDLGACGTLPCHFVDTPGGPNPHIGDSWPFEDPFGIFDIFGARDDAIGLSKLDFVDGLMSLRRFLTLGGLIVLEDAGMLPVFLLGVFLFALGPFFNSEALAASGISAPLVAFVAFALFAYERFTLFLGAVLFRICSDLGGPVPLKNKSRPGESGCFDCLPGFGSKPPSLGCHGAPPGIPCGVPCPPPNPFSPSCLP